MRNIDSTLALLLLPIVCYGVLAFLAGAALALPAVPNQKQPAAKSTVIVTVAQKKSANEQAAYFMQQAQHFKDQLEYAKEADALSEAIELTPADSRLYEMRADAYDNSLMFDQALADLRTAVNLLPTKSGYLNRLAHMYFKMGRLELAVKTYDKAIELDPSDAAPHRERGRILQKLARDKEAILDYEKFAALNGNDRHGEVVQLLGSLYLKIGNTEKALAAFNREIKMVPDLPGGYHGRAQAYLRMGRKDLADKDEQTAAEIEKSY